MRDFITVLLAMGCGVLGQTPSWTLDGQRQSNDPIVDFFKKSEDAIDKMQPAMEAMDAEAKKYGKAIADQFGKKAIPILKEKLNTPSEYSQKIAIWAFGYIGDRDGLSLLVTKTPDKRVHGPGVTVFLAIMESPEDDARWALEQILTHHDWIITSCGFLRAVGDLNTVATLEKVRQQKLDIFQIRAIQSTVASIRYRLETLKDVTEQKAYAEFERALWESYISTA